MTSYTYTGFCIVLPEPGKRPAKYARAHQAHGIAYGPEKYTDNSAVFDGQAANPTAN